MDFRSYNYLSPFNYIHKYSNQMNKKKKIKENKINTWTIVEGPLGSVRVYSWILPFPPRLLVDFCRLAPAHPSLSPSTLFLSLKKKKYQERNSLMLASLAESNPISPTVTPSSFSPYINFQNGR